MHQLAAHPESGSRPQELKRSRYRQSIWGSAPVRNNYMRAPANSRAWNNPGCSTHVIRGGSWGSAPDQIRSAFRLGTSSDTRNSRIGFRVARDL